MDAKEAISKITEIARESGVSVILNYDIDFTEGTMKPRGESMISYCHIKGHCNPGSKFHIYLGKD